MDPEQNNQDTNDGEKNGEVVDLTGWNVEEKDDKDKHDTDDENESMVRKNIFHFYYNLIHSLKMVIVKPYLDTVQENDVYRHWVKMSTSYDITKKKNGKSEAIFYYNTTAKGDGAFLDLKTNIEDKDVKVFHPHAELKQKIGKYWECLKTLCSIGKAPVNPDIGEKIFSRLIIIEKVPESVTEDELIERFPEAINVLCFPHIKGTKGLRILEFENETTAMKFLREHKDEEIDGASVRMTKYGRRASEWDEKNNKEKYTTCILPDDDRIEKCKRMIEIVTKLTELNNREDIFGEEKVVEFQQLYEEKLLLSDQLKSDTDYRKLKKMSFPEDEDIRTSYTQFAEKKEWDRSSRAKKAAIAYGIEKESRKSSHKTRSVSPVGKDKEKDDKNKCFNCGGKGHFARDCPSEKEGVDCYNCGKSGHFARDCRLPSNKKGGPGGRRRSRSPPYEAPHSKRRARSRDRRDSERDRFGFRSRSPVYRDDRRGGKRQTSPMVLGRGDHGLECFKCGNGGHYARDCPGMMDIKKGGDGCYKCGMSGHFARDCTDYGSQPAKSGKCYNCGGDGHMARECSMQQQDSKPRKPCFNCGEDGHMARDCPMPQQDSKQRKACFNCGGDGHMARDCPMQQQDSSQRKSCYNCRENGHLARDCPHQDQVKQNETCFKCGGTGHYSRDCSSSDAGNRARSDKCYMCKGEGHFARDCPNRTAGTGSSGGGSGRDVSDSYRRDSMSDQADQWRSSGMDDRSMGNSSHNSGSMAVQGNVHSYGDTNMGAFGDAGGGLNASSELVANVMRMAGVTNARPTEVAAILQNISQSLSSSVSRLERADVDSRVGRY